MNNIAGKEHHDLSQIAVRYGGGGHKGACGFRITLAQLAEIL
jgi:nanoRNase/pAp phosphatase (c-di-AMP/oligoRNAs hydrolase)